jgi:hypothetical protein
LTIDLQAVSLSLGSRIGLSPSFRSNVSGNVLSQWRFEELPRPLGFSIHVQVELGIARAVLKLDTMASGLVKSINEFAEVNHEITKNLIAEIDKSRMQVEIRNHSAKSETSLGPFDGTFEIHGRAALGDPVEDIAELLDVVVSLFAFMAGEHLEHDDVSFKREGRAYRIETNKYERSRFNRSLAIKIHGLKCFGCDFDFERFYGPVGMGIIEIHHLLPVHLMAERRVVDPRSELVPLCSNCHTLVHREDPPFTIEQLRSFVTLARTK